jgi:hypothetical protein
MKNMLLMIISIIVLNSCYTTPTSTIAPNVDFSKYSFAAIGTDSTGSSVILADAHMKIQNALISCGFNVIVDTRIRALEYEERTKLFVVEFSISSNSDESVCLIYFTDYLSGNILATFRGSFGLALNIAGDQRGAVDSAIRQMLNTLQGNV